MTSQANHRLTSIGFILIYFAAMGSLFVVSSPLYDTTGRPLLTYVMLPTAVLGVVLVVCARLGPVDAA